jgi:cysteine-rich repeat protein
MKALLRLLFAGVLLASGTSRLEAVDCGAVPAWATANLAQIRAGDQVSNRGRLFRCKPFPQGGWCQVRAYEPGTQLGDSAWDRLASCAGLPAPVSCEDAIDQGLFWVQGSSYALGTRVLGPPGSLYQCEQPGPGFCDAVQPATNNAVWSFVEECDISIDSPDLFIESFRSVEQGDCGGPRAHWSVTIGNATGFDSATPATLEFYRTSGVPGDAGVLVGTKPIPIPVAPDVATVSVQPEIEFGPFPTRAPWIRLVVRSGFMEANLADNVSLQQLWLCQRTDACGNGRVDAAEDCDDGNRINTDACTNRCTAARCGDAIVRTAVEECDDGNANDLDACDTACVFRPLRRNIAHVSAAERQKLASAMARLDMVQYQDLVSQWDKQDQIHQATHVHNGPDFLPWHRELVNRFERLLRQVDPTVALHYWDWTTDPRHSPDGRGGFVDLFTAQAFGSAIGRAGAPFDSLDNGGQFMGSRDQTGDPRDPPASIDRGVACVAGPPLDADIIGASNGLPQNSEWQAFREALESEHGDKHGCMGGTISQVHSAFEDPFVFLLHSNVDRIFAMWQLAPGKRYRLDPSQIYGIETDVDRITRLLEPWDGAAGMTPWNPAEPGNEVVKKNCLDPSIVRPPRYDTLP